MDQIQKKLMTKFSDKLKKTLLLAHFPNFWDNFFLKKTPALSCTTTQASNTMLSFRKN